MRKARERSSTGIYHIVNRGLDRQVIFHNHIDYDKYLNLLNEKTNVTRSSLLGYCLMDNHVHLLIDEGLSSISDLMRSVGAGYALWFNRKYDRSGYLFQNRFHSEAVDDERYLLAVIRYIHLNPVKAGIVHRPEDYRWSSCNTYYGKKESGFLQTDLILSLFSDNLSAAQELFESFMREESNDQCLDVKYGKRKTDAQVYNDILKILGSNPITQLNQLNKTERDAILKELKTIEGSSVRQIARLTNIGMRIVSKA